MDARKDELKTTEDLGDFLQALALHRIEGTPLLKLKVDKIVFMTWELFTSLPPFSIVGDHEAQVMVSPRAKEDPDFQHPHFPEFFGSVHIR